VPPGTVAAEQEPFFISLGGPKAHDPSVEIRGKPRQPVVLERTICPVIFPYAPGRTLSGFRTIANSAPIILVSERGRSLKHSIA
jgi:hypothetical protein